MGLTPIIDDSHSLSLGHGRGTPAINGLLQISVSPALCLLKHSGRMKAQPVL